MARIRTIKPSLWTDEALAECAPIARLLFIASLNFADDNGNLERSARQLKAQAFPYDNVDCEPMIAELVRAGLLIEYEVGDRKYLHIKGFLAHQRIDKPGKSPLPVYEPSAIPRQPVPEHSTNDRRTVQESSASVPAVREGNGREGKGQDSPLRGAPVRPRRDSAARQRVFDHWRKAWNHPGAKLLAKRSRVIDAALQGYDEAELCRSIDGYMLSPFHCGQNDSRTRHDAIDLFLRDEKHIEAGLQFAQGAASGKPPPEPMTTGELAQLAKFVESRRGSARTVDEIIRATPQQLRKDGWEQAVKSSYAQGARH
jgi:hypothetical protein